MKNLLLFIFLFTQTLTAQTANVWWEDISSINYRSNQGVITGASRFISSPVDQYNQYIKAQSIGIEVFSTQSNTNFTIDLYYEDPITPTQNLISSITSQTNGMNIANILLPNHLNYIRFPKFIVRPSMISPELTSSGLRNEISLVVRELNVKRDFNFCNQFSSLGRVGESGKLEAEYELSASNHGLLFPFISINRNYSPVQIPNVDGLIFLSHPFYLMEHKITPLLRGVSTKIQLDYSLHWSGHGTQVYLQGILLAQNGIIYTTRLLNYTLR